MRRRNKINIVGLLRIILIILLFPIVIVWCISKFFSNKKEQRVNADRINIFNLNQIDSLSGIEFENLIKTIFEKQGYKVLLTKKSHDYGADLILEMKKQISVLQAKRYSGNVGIKAIQEIIAAKKHYKASDCFVATNNYFSKEAILLATENGVKLIDRDVLSSFIKKYSPTISVEGKKYSATENDARNQIEQKYKFWI